MAEEFALGKPAKRDLAAPEVRRFRDELSRFLAQRDARGRVWTDAQWGVYAFYDYDGEPIYVGQTNEKLRTRIRRHLTGQRTDAVAMRILDVFEVAEVEVWPLWELEGVSGRDSTSCRLLDAYEYTAYLDAIERSRFRAILNEKIPPVSPTVTLPASLRWSVVTDAVREERGHADIRIARRAETVSRLAAVAHERGEVSDGLRRVLVVQAVRLAFLAAERFAFASGTPAPDPAAISVEQLVGSVRSEQPERYELPERAERVEPFDQPADADEVDDLLEYRLF
ncbi:GIY-YIG nuclease family protein [Mycetocola tolaasinivorans]|uniref:GIY-YIG nuclease family protein n=1 Tax=Mycetocola tolaasinivorans TaxID=76635 RepID=A0A3L6ZYT5_9MICO|nr:GIY-YIG nuclease family protein [Mycetocola tolaasinivorans]RLP73203.1 GIY-YIG nuclease family protein [Mycetocola tolaasinivorans]